MNTIKKVRNLGLSEKEREEERVDEDVHDMEEEKSMTMREPIRKLTLSILCMERIPHKREPLLKEFHQIGFLICKPL